MKRLTLAILTITLASCTGKSELDSKYKVTDDEVLLEFATKLEIEYHQFYDDRLHSVPANPHTAPEPGKDPSHTDSADHPMLDQ